MKIIVVIVFACLLVVTGCRNVPIEKVPSGSLEQATLHAAFAAQGKTTELGFDRDKYVFVPIDKHSPSDALTDSDLAPFILPAAMHNDWWHIIAIPTNIHDGTPHCIYVRKSDFKVMGYVINRPSK